MTGRNGCTVGWLIAPTLTFSETVEARPHSSERYTHSTAHSGMPVSA